MSILHGQSTIARPGGAVVQPLVNLDATIVCVSLVGSVKLELFGTGVLIRTLLADVGISNNWVSNAEMGGDYGAFFEAYLTTTSGTNPTGAAVDTWLTINTELQWDWAETDEFDGSLEIREIADPSGNTDTATIDVNDNP